MKQVAGLFLFRTGPKQSCVYSVFTFCTSHASVLNDSIYMCIASLCMITSKLYTSSTQRGEATGLRSIELNIVHVKGLEGLQM